MVQRSKELRLDWSGDELPPDQRQGLLYLSKLEIIIVKENIKWGS